MGAAFLTLLLAVFSYPRLGFSADRHSLFRATDQELEQREEFQRRFGGWNDLMVVLDGGTPAEREVAAMALGKTLSGSPLFEDVRATLELPGLQNQALYFLSIEELGSIDRSLAEHGTALRQLSLDGWYGFLASASQQSEAAPKDEQRERFSKIWKQSVESRGAAELGDLFSPLKVPARAFYTDGPQRHLIFFRSSQPLAALQSLHEHRRSLQFSGRVVMLGQPLLRAQEESETVRDAVLSAVLSILLVQLLLIHGFRETARPRLAFLSLVFGLVWATAWAALAVGTLNIITVNFISITVGLGIDFSVHYLARYAEERVHSDALEAMTTTWRTTGVEILVGAVATSLAFFALILTDFQAVKELGLIAGVAILLCFVSVVVLLPPLIFWHERRRGFAPLDLVTVPWLRQAEEWLRSYPRQALAISLLVVLVLGVFGNRVRFDYNLLNLQVDSFEAIAYEKESGFCTLAAYVVADDPEQAMVLKERLEGLSSVSRVTTVAEFFPRQPQAKEALVASIVARAQTLPLPSFDAQAEPDWARLRSLTQGWEDRPQRPGWVEALSDSGPGPVEAVWRQMQAHLHKQLGGLLETLQKQQTGLDIAQWKAKFPALLRYSSADGKTLLRVQGKHSLWERVALSEFTDQLATVTDRGVGPPYLIRSYLEQMRKSYFDAVRYAVAAIVVLLLLYFRSGLRTFIALVPKLAGTVGMLGAMGICGVNFNPANCMALPLTLGIGLVFGIHAVHRCLEHPDELLVDGSTGKSISLAAWTDIASFGTMLVASNPGIFSIGFVMAVGVGANLVATYLLVPPLVVIFRERLSKK
jgi:predicted RND superfamily exporter protein